MEPIPNSAVGRIVRHAGVEECPWKLAPELQRARRRPASTGRAWFQVLHWRATTAC
jgi:hypothetical protein